MSHSKKGNIDSSSELSQQATQDAQKIAPSPVSIADLAAFCRRKGFIFPSGALYGGLAGFFDYGPLGIELKRNLTTHWWNRFVRSRSDVSGIDGSIITHPLTWKASGHTDNFADILVEDTVTHERFRADHLVEDALGIPCDGKNEDELWSLIEKQSLRSPAGNPLSRPQRFNMMFSTQVGPVVSNESLAFLRPETAQSIFVNFKPVAETTRQQLPFGIAQIGKSFRNEISPRNFIFRLRELEMMELEFFVHPEELKKELKTKGLTGTDSDAASSFSLLTEKHRLLRFQFLSAAQQEKQDAASLPTVSINDLVQSGVLHAIHAYWLAEAFLWYTDLGVNPSHLRIREHLTTERSHYSQGTFDIEYHFPFGWKEIHGSANRGTFDLDQHSSVSKQALEIFDEATKQKVLPAVIEPSWGVDRAFLVFLYDAYEPESARGTPVLHLHPQLAPYALGIFPLMKKDGLLELAQEIYTDLASSWHCFFDVSGSIGRRYARQDEVGTPYCITVDYQSKDDGTVTLRDRESTEQKRISREQLPRVLRDLLSGCVTFSSLK